MAQLNRVVRAIPKWLLTEYLVEEGGKVQKDGSIASDKWTATIDEMEKYTIGNMSAAQVRLIVEGEEEDLEALEESLKEKWLRAGA